MRDLSKCEKEGGGEREGRKEEEEEREERTERKRGEVEKGTKEITFERNQANRLNELAIEHVMWLKEHQFCYIKKRKRK